MFVARPRYAALRARYQEVVEERDEAVKLAAERLSTITRQAAEITRLRDRTPDTPLPQPSPPAGDVELRRQLRLARGAVASLDSQCRTLQSSNEAQAQELRDLREGATS
ncbi:hypothetical protein [Streptomyces sp. AK02-04a]|uniref:hypothetical protein n=1 Tax=Streptomyces sp. AK02-04a TaxID=3028649 RepID=UPI0029B61594|nr:hypothetical protein [Streptomyces sp. AK02-04a]MDX3759291.1 hypothetical protein [Streptomyces sp. AK02-04a]